MDEDVRDLGFRLGLLSRLLLGLRRCMEIGSATMCSKQNPKSSHTSLCTMHVLVTHANQPEHVLTIVKARKLAIVCLFASLVCLFPLLAIHRHLALVLLKGKSTKELSWGSPCPTMPIAAMCYKARC